ncbi:MAG: hypothetical protein NT128_04760 [Proteobacteria bacterium]|nr:hypothetical protein [Pseudomonadota bacterium]
MSIFFTRNYTALVACFIFASLYAAEKKEDSLESNDLRVSLIITSKQQDCSHECTIERRVRGNNTSLTIKSRTPIERTDRKKLVNTIRHIDKITEDLLGKDLNDYSDEKPVLTCEKFTSTEDDSDCKKLSTTPSPRPVPDEVAETPKQSSYSIYKWIIPIGGTIALIALNWAKIMNLRKCR